MKKQNEPKIKSNFGTCHNYSKLKKEGLVDNQKTEEEWIRLQRTGGGAET